ncbi:MAG: EAL domain-containing protein [Firmicutes bacterium]|nr:EAL domain-containing protein [Bacillota bacterium]
MVLSYNSRSTQHRVLFCSFLCLSWWAFAFTVANNAPDIETALLWRRLASAGWGIYYSLLLHYILILTERNALLRKRWLYLLLYLPAVLNVFLYGIYNETALASYNLLKTPLGWVNIAGLTALDLSHFASYIVFTLASIIYLLHWGVTAQDRIKRIIALLIACSAFLALIIGTLTEHLINAVFRVSFPQVGPIVIMFPALTMFYCIRRYGMMRQMPKDMAPAEDQLLSEYAQTRLFLYLALAAFLGGFVSFASLFFTSNAALPATLLVSAVFMLAGIIVYMTRSFRLKADIKDTIVGVVMAVTLPVITVLIYEYTASYSWNIPMVFVVIAIVFSNKKIIVLMGISVLFTLIWSWVRVPVLQIAFAGIDHAVRMTVMTVMFVFVLYINHIFKQALAEIQEKASREKLLSDIASALMTINENNVEAKLKEVMAMWERHLQANCMDIFFLDNEQRTVKSAIITCGCGTKSATALSAAEKEEIYAAAIGLGRLWDEGSSGSVEVNTESATESLWAEKITAGVLTFVPLKNAVQLIGIVAIEKMAGRAGWKEEQQKICHIVARMITDVWLKIEADKKIKYEAYYDSLTGLPNRRHFTDRLMQAVNMAKRTDKLVGVFFIDIDSFKCVNDTMGHAGGDQLLQQIGQRMRKSVRKYDVVARFGGDEFLIMVPQAEDVAAIERVAAKILENLKEPVAVKEQKFFISVSMGIAIYPYDGDEPDTLLKNADIAMYVSKEIGKNRYALCSVSMKKDAHASITLTNDLHWALERDELFLYYQPQLEAKTEEVTGTEALLRWRHPHLGMIAPSLFIPLAEKSGLISSIGAWIINQACLQNKSWQEAGLKPITVAVNLSLGQFMDANLVEVVQNALEKSGLSPKYLELEITESIAAQDSQNIARTMDRLKALGVRIAIDDFGSGYSSLDRFKAMPVDKLKIAMRFVHGIGSSNKDEEIIKVILQLGRTFGIKVLAEGVEDKKQLFFLRENSCDEIQGFYYYKPLTADRMGEVLLKQQSL